MADPLHTRLCDEYGCEVPIVAFNHTKDVVAAVTNAGGIGILGANVMTCGPPPTSSTPLRRRSSSASRRSGPSPRTSESGRPVVKRAGTRQASP